MTKYSELNFQNRIRKIEIIKTQYKLPDYTDETLYLLDRQYEGELRENADRWLDSMRNKSQYAITESLCCNW